LENDFSNRIHAGKLSVMRFRVNAAKLQTRNVIKNRLTKLINCYINTIVTN
jgi:hypothetical protein